MRSYITFYNLIFVITFLLVLPFLVSGFFANPWTDDLYYSFIAKDQGIFDALIYYYTHFNGRYLSITLLLLNPLSFDLIWGYKLIPPLIILMTAMGVFSLLAQFTAKSLPLKNRLFFTLLILLVFFDQMPDVRPGLYWISASVTYLAAGSLFLIFLALLCKVRQNRDSRHTGPKVGAVILALLLPGANEIILALLLGLLICLFSYDVYQQKKADIFLLSTLIAAGTGAGFALFTPSNLIRMSTYEGSRDLLLTLEKAFLTTTTSMTTWLGTPLVLLMTLLVAITVYKNTPLANHLKKIHPAITSSLFLLAIFGTYFVPFWGMGLHPPRRVENLVYLLFLVGWLINTAILTAFARQKIASVLQRAPQKLLLFVFAIYLLGAWGMGHSNLILVSKDLFSGTSYRYDQELQQRYAFLRENPAPECSVKMLRNQPKSLFFGDIYFTGDNWINRSYADYFGKTTILLERPQNSSEVD